MLVLLLACGWGPFGADGGQSGNEGDGMAAYCEEVSRTPIGLDDLPAGFMTTPRQLIDGATGDWSGWFSGDPTDGIVFTDAEMTVSWDGDLPVLVTEVLVSSPGEALIFSDSDTGHTSSDRCPLRYELPLTAVFTAHDGAFDHQVLAVTCHVAADGRDVRVAMCGSTLPVGTITGTAELPWNPTDWDTNDLDWGGDLVEDGGTFGLAGEVKWISVRAESAPDGSSSVSTRDETLGGFFIERL